MQVFDIHDAVDALAPRELHGPDNFLDDRPNESVTLKDVCYKPFGDECAVESVAQYWQLNRAQFEKDASPHLNSLEYCLSHWSTACRCALAYFACCLVACRFVANHEILMQLLTIGGWPNIAPAMITCRPPSLHPVAWMFV